ncbi:unnamed protein product [Notodromas monacha]|uniref:SURF1-like protein n=1 Tax=Notodromas monacha TaxID=399045 RepID=A0A7R9BQ43_9CRUS|nr:unnamed protein product [Notodromas monacha]CAG0918088.1 unnamed protein product [Notodromas monacha]
MFCVCRMSGVTAIVGRITLGATKRLPNVRNAGGNASDSAKLLFERRRARISAYGYSLLVIPAATFALGCWQVKRRRWKLDLIKELEEKTGATPILLPDSFEPETFADLEYRPVTVRGEFLHSQEMYLSPRSLVTNEKNPKGGGIISDPSRSGSWVVTPFKLSERDMTILVNRGFVPRSKTKPEARPVGQVEGPVTLTGIFRLDEPRANFQWKNQAEGVNWNYRDVTAMAAKVGAVPIFLDADAASTVPGGPVGGQTRVTLRNEHLSYIITWFGLSASTSFLWYAKFIKRMPVF